ncbi:MAG TPA: hypothetical protein VGP68_10740, partial [Gemmataceae bacterium]|nr:hypothetical protein [Gemmataceae bacterium]
GEPCAFDPGAPHPLPPMLGPDFGLSPLLFNVPSKKPPPPLSQLPNQANRIVAGAKRAGRPLQKTKL